MTLDTRVAIGTPTDIRKLFALCQRLVNTPAGRGELNQDYRPGVRLLGNPVGIGADSLVWLFYAPDGPLPVHEHDEWCPVSLGGKYDVTQEQIDEHAASIADDPTENGWAAIEVSFDTPYGYRGDGGETCSDQHARLVSALGHWLDNRGLPWKWKNEYTGEWFDAYEQLDSFGDAHRVTGADDWFRSVVVPCIESGGAA